MCEEICRHSCDTIKCYSSKRFQSFWHSNPFWILAALKFSVNFSQVLCQSVQELGFQPQSSWWTLPAPNLSLQTPWSSQCFCTSSISPLTLPNLPFCFPIVWEPLCYIISDMFLGKNACTAQQVYSVNKRKFKSELTSGLPTDPSCTICYALFLVLLFFCSWVTNKFEELNE